MISEDGTGSEYKYNSSHIDTHSKIDDEVSSIYVARWFKVSKNANKVYST